MIPTSRTSDGLIEVFDCPVCHFYKNSAEGLCRRLGCEGVVERIEYMPVPGWDEREKIALGVLGDLIAAADAAGDYESSDALERAYLVVQRQHRSIPVGSLCECREKFGSFVLGCTGCV